MNQAKSQGTFERPIHRYTNLEPYRLGKGHGAQLPDLIDRIRDAIAIVSLDSEQPSNQQFLRLVHREMKIRKYAQPTIKTYRSVCTSLLRWFGRPAHLLDREHVREYLEYLVDAGHGSSDLSVQLSAIRLIWDKMCFRDVTLGLETPRRKRRRVAIASRDEICRLLQAANTLRDTLLLGLMYGTGMRVSEVCRIKWKDLDRDRNQIFVDQGKGRADRHVQLPQQYRELLAQLEHGRTADDYVFQSESNRRTNEKRHLSPRTAERAVAKAREIAGIKKNLTPHSLRHAFATHSFEDGCDIRRIQAVLGHTRLETTTIYVKVAQQRTSFPSPLDRLQQTNSGPAGNSHTNRNHTSPHRPNTNAPGIAPKSAVAPRKKPSVGTLRIHSRPHPECTDQTGNAPNHAGNSATRTQITVELKGTGYREFLTGTVAELSRPGYVTLELPPLENWSSTLSKLPSNVRERIQEPDFYQVLQSAITRRMLQPAPQPNSLGPAE